MIRKTNIIHLIPGIGIGGSAESVLYDLCRYTDRTRFHIIVLYWNDGALAELMREAGVEVVKLNFKKVISVSSVRMIAALLKRYKTDILHTHFIDGDFLGFMASRLTRVKVVSHIHSYPFPSEKRHALRYRLMSKGVSRYVCVSDFVKKYFVAYTGIKPAKVCVVRNGIDRTHFEDRLPRAEKEELKRSLGFLPGDVLIGNVSRIMHEKGHDVFLKAALMILTRRPEARFLIVGDGDLLPAVKDLAQKLGIAEHVVFTGMRRDIPQLLGCMDVFVFPAVNEAFGLCLAEAMASSRPIVATGCAAVPEVMRDGLDGLFVPPGDEAAMARAILHLLDDKALAGMLAANAYRRSGSFTSSTMTHDMEQVYTEVLSA